MELRKREGNAVKKFTVRAILLGIGLLTVTSHQVLALERQTIAQGLSACYAWCDKNRSGAERSKCKANCDVYWNCEGSDSNNKTCMDAIFKSNARAQGQPTQPPQPLGGNTGTQKVSPGSATK